MTEMRRQQINLNTYTLRTKTFKGKKYLVVPVVMMRNGVHSGSHGPIRHTTEELSKYVEAWNGIPVTVTHPRVNDQFVSANSPEVLEQFSVGTIFNTRMDGDKLKAEAYIHEPTLKRISINALTAIKNNRPLDVSVGVFTDEREEQGEWNGETYTAVAANYRPDHLALLPGQSGACSWEDGCGIRTNQNKDNMNYEHEDERKLLSLNVNLFPEPEGFQVNEIGYIELREKCQRKLDTMDGAGKTYYLEELFNDYLIMQVRMVETRDFLLYKQSYQITSDNNIEFVGEPIKVKKEINYLQTNKKEDQMEKQSPCCPEKVTKLINHEMTAYTESDRDWLNQVESDRLDKMFPREVQANAEPATDEEIREQISGYEQSKILELLPEQMQVNVKAGLQVLEDARNEKIDLIMDNTEEGTWDKEELTAMSDSTLDKIAKSLKIAEEIEVPADYTGQAVSQQRTKVQTNSDEVVEPMLPLGVTKEGDK